MIEQKLMATIKRTYRLPAGIVEEFERHIPRGKRSAFITRLLSHWLDELRRNSIRGAIIEGCRDMADAYLATEREYHALEEEIEQSRQT